MKKNALSLLISIVLAVSCFSSCDKKAEESQDTSSHPSITDTGQTVSSNTSEKTNFPGRPHSTASNKEQTAPSDTQAEANLPGKIYSTASGKGQTTFSDPLKPSESNPNVAHVHSYDKWTIVYEPTCEKQGLQEAFCSCGNRTTAPIPKVAHNYVNNVCTFCKKSGSAPSFVPDYSTGQANTVGSEASCSRYTSQGDWIYFAPTQNQISKFKKGSFDIIPVYSLSSGNIFNVNVVGDWIYFYVGMETTSTSYIAKVRTDGSNFEKILSSINVGDMLVVKDTIFFTTIKSPYVNYAKDCAPLYSMSVNGGMPKQLHDGYVMSITSDGKYLYFLQVLKSKERTIYRMRCDTGKEDIIFKNVNTNGFTLSNSKLYFLTLDRYSDECTITSIATTGGSYTTYGKIPYYSEWLYVVGDKAYYYGVPYSEGEFIRTAGIIEYNMSTKQYKVIKESYDIITCFFTSNLLIDEEYDDTGYSYILNSVLIYDPHSNNWKKYLLEY